MIPTNPSDRTTLLLSKAYLPFMFLSARASIKHLMTDKIHALDADGNLHDFASFVDTDRLFENMPCLRSAHSEFAVPTIAVSRKTFGFHRKNTDKFLSTRTLYKIYKGVCQYCLEKITLDQASKDHFIPKSAGGTNHDFNLVLACKRCNQLKDSTFPYYDVNGNTVRPKTVTPFIFSIDDHIIVRDEWNQFLYRD